MSQSDSQRPEHHDSASHHANEKVQKYHAKYWDVYLLGLGMVLGGVCVNWNLGSYDYCAQFTLLHNI